VPARPIRPSGDLCKLLSSLMSWERAVFRDAFCEGRVQLREKDMKCARHLPNGSVIEKLMPLCRCGFESPWRRILIAAAQALVPDSFHSIYLRAEATLSTMYTTDVHRFTRYNLRRNLIRHLRINSPTDFSQIIPLFEETPQRHGQLH